MPALNPGRNLLYIIKILETGQPQDNIIHMPIQLNLSIKSRYCKQIHWIMGIVVRVGLFFETFVGVDESY